MITPGPSTRCFDFHGLAVRCEAESSVLSALDARFGAFPLRSDDRADLRFDYHRGSAPRSQPTEARVVYESPMGRVAYEPVDDRLLVDTVWPIQAECDPVAGRTSIRVDGPMTGYRWELAHPLVTLPLIEKLKRRGRFSLHAAGLAAGGRALLFPGASGSGKSTLALALAREGFAFLGDDMLFVVERTEGLRVQAFPEAFDLTDATVQMFPDLADVLAREKPPGFPKHQLQVNERYGAPIVVEARPVALIFPRVAQRSHSELSPLDRTSALLELAPNILLTDPIASQRHFDALSALVEACDCYRLDTGTDFSSLALRLRTLLESAP